MENRNFRELITSTKPIVFKNVLAEPWASIAWNFSSLIEQCGSVVLHFRIVPKSKTGLVWEGDAKYVEASIQNYIEWINKVPSELNPFSSYSVDEYWAYSSYNSMHLKFDENNKFKKGIDWSIFGLTTSDDQDSSFWIGSKGAFTPCHVDTYGCNLVAQIIGRKQWILFPPEDNNFMYLTRIPYEESSIFSPVDILRPDILRYPLFQNSHPHVITLEPGDVLFVPEKWWHFVHSLDHSVSVNTWISVESDDENRLKEATTRALFTTFFNSCGFYNQDWINPAEEVTSFEDAIELVKMTTLKLMSERNSRCNDEVSSPPSSKVKKFSDDKEYLQTNPILLNSRTVFPINFSDFNKMYCFEEKPSGLNANSLNADSLDIQSLINCFLHPDVIECICAKLKDLIKQ